MTVWPSIAKYGIARTLGRAYSIRAGWYIFTVGNLLALALAPLSAVLYFFRVLPGIGERYTLTNRRVIIERGVMGEEMQSVALGWHDDKRMAEDYKLVDEYLKIEKPYDVNLWESDDSGQWASTVVAPLDPADYHIDPLAVM